MEAQGFQGSISKRLELDRWCKAKVSGKPHFPSVTWLLDQSHHQGALNGKAPWRQVDLLSQATQHCPPASWGQLHTEPPRRTKAGWAGPLASRAETVSCNFPGLTGFLCFSGSLWVLRSEGGQGHRITSRAHCLPQGTYPCYSEHHKEGGQSCDITFQMSMKHAGERLFSCPKAQWPFVLSIGLASETWLSVLALSLQPWAICLATGQNASDMAFLPHRHRLQTFSSTSLTHQKGEHVLAGLGPGTQAGMHKAFPCTGAFYMQRRGQRGHSSRCVHILMAHLKWGLE